MALGCSENNYIYLNIAFGKITQRTNEDTPNAKSRTISKGPNAGKIVFEKHFDFIEAYLNDFEIKDSDYGEKLTFAFQDGEKIYLLDVPFSSKIATIFFSRLPNINPEYPLKLSVFSTKKEDGTEITLCALFQKGAKIDAFHTRENPQGMPELKVIERRGKKEYDNTDILVWQESQVQSFSAKFREAARNRGGSVDFDKNISDNNETEIEDEPLPF